MSKEEIENATQRIAREWFAGLGLEYAGVKLGDCMVYDLLTVLGRIWLPVVGNG